MKPARSHPKRPRRFQKHGLTAMSTADVQAPGGEARDPGRSAARLSLTPRQRQFAEALAVDPERNQTRAALAAGATSQPEIQGSRWARMSKVQEYIAALTGQVFERREARAIADIARVLEVLSRQLEGTEPAEWETAAFCSDGPETAQQVIKRKYRPQAAAIALGTMLSAPVPPQTNNTLVLAGLDPEVLRALLRHAMSGNGGLALPR